jgi:hypothetical protein
MVNRDAIPDLDIAWRECAITLSHLGLQCALPCTTFCLRNLTCVTLGDISAYCGVELLCDEWDMEKDLLHSCKVQVAKSIVPFQKEFLAFRKILILIYESYVDLRFGYGTGMRIPNR